MSSQGLEGREGLRTKYTNLKDDAKKVNNSSKMSKKLQFSYILLTELSN